MHLARVGSGLVLLTLMACLADTAPNAPPVGDLDGKWGWDLNGNPGGSSLNATFVTSGSQVTGAGTICGIGPHCTPGDVTITGNHVPGYGDFDLTFAGPGGFTATYSGQFVGHDQLQGTWTRGGQTGALTLNRCGQATFCW